jgi:hypothetical protein
MRRIMLLLVSLAVGLILGSGVALTVPSTLVGGGTIQEVLIVRETAVSTTSSTSFADIPGTFQGITVPTGGRLIMVRFSAESSCSGGAGTVWCSIRIMAQNTATGAITEMQPASGSDFAFDSRDQSVSWESHSMDRSLRLPAGSYIIRPQMAVVSPNPAPGQTFFSIDDYSLTIEKAQ